MNLQINKGNAKTQNIENQYIYPPVNNRGTAFVPLSECREEKYYTEIKDSLYYPPEYLDKIVSTLETEHSILIQGEQGSGKSTLSFKIAEQMQSQGLITSAYYLNPPSDWNMIKEWMQSVHFQEKISHNEGIHLWIIDNLHKIADAIEDFPDSSIWGADYCICCTRNLNHIPSGDDVYYKIALSKKQIFRRNIDEKIFLECYNTLADNKIGRRESDYLYQYIGGNLALLKYIITSGNLPRSLADWSKGQFIDFHNIYVNYFGFETTNRITKENLDDTLKMLFLSQIDFSIPLYLQCDTCQTVLKHFYFEIENRELEMEHTSLAELLTVCICKEHRLNYSGAFTDCIHWTLLNLVNHRLEESEQIRQINRFLQLLYSYQFVLNQKQSLQKLLSDDKCLTDFLEKNVGFIQPSTWKKITETAEEDSKINEVFHKFATSAQFIDTLCSYCDYDFQFFKYKLSPSEQAEVETQLLSRITALTESIVKNGTEVHLMHLLLSLSEETAITFVEQIPSHDLVSLLSGNNNGLYLFARYYSLLGNEVQDSLDAKISTDDYRHILMNSTSVKGIASLLAAATDSLRKRLCRLLTEDELSDRLIRNTIENNDSIGTLGLLLRELKRKFTETLTIFESAIGITGYERLLQVQGTIPVLVRLIEYSSPEMRTELSGMLQSNPQLVQTLLERTIMEGHSIGTLDLSLRELKKESAGALTAFEGAIGITGYERLLQVQGTIPVLAHLIEHSSPEMRTKLSAMLQSNPQLVQTLLERTIMEGRSIGTLPLSLRELKKESAGALTAFEGAIGITGYERLLLAQGTIPVLVHLIRHSSLKMQTELSGMLQSNPQLVQTLLERTITEGHSIGTLDLSLRELKKKSAGALTAFESAIGITGYERLLLAQGTIPVLVLLIGRSSPEMRTELSGMLQSNPQLVQTLLERTITEGHSIGTLNLSLGALKKESAGALTAFESAIDITGYERLLLAQGTIPVLARLIENSSTEMQKEMSQMLQSNPQLVQTLLERTITEGHSIGTLNLSLKTLGRKNVPCLQILENAIGVDGYLEMFSKCNANTITIMRIMACSSLSDSLVDKIYTNTAIWQESMNYISKDSCTILRDFNCDLFYAKQMNREKFFHFIRKSISAEEWLDWMRCGATLEEAVLIMRSLPFGTAKQLSNVWLQNYAEVIEDILFVGQRRTEKRTIAPQVINRTIESIQNYNRQLSVLLDKEYRSLLSDHNSKLSLP